LPPINKSSLFENLIQMIILTEDPLSNHGKIKQFSQDPNLLVESAHNKLINFTKQQDYVPVANII